MDELVVQFQFQYKGIIIMIKRYTVKYEALFITIFHFIQYNITF